MKDLSPSLIRVFIACCTLQLREKNHLLTSSRDGDGGDRVGARHFSEFGWKFLLPCNLSSRVTVFLYIPRRCSIKLDLGRLRREVKLSEACVRNLTNSQLLKVSFLLRNSELKHFCIFFFAIKKISKI